MYVPLGDCQGIVGRQLLACPVSASMSQVLLRGPKCSIIALTPHCEQESDNMIIFLGIWGDTGTRRQGDELPASLFLRVVLRHCYRDCVIGNVDVGDARRVLSSIHNGRMLT